MNSTPRCAHPSEEAFWIRDPESSWVAQPFDEMFCAGGAWSLGVVDARVAIVGAGTGDVPFAWFSDDGERWIDSGFPRNLFPRLLAASGHDVVALGSAADGILAIARSDGRNPWVVSPAAGLPIGLAPATMVEGGDGLIAWVTDESGAQRTFTSARGDLWRPFAQQGIDGILMSNVRKVDRAYVALARDRGGEVLLVSADSTAWRKSPTPAAIGHTGTLRDLAIRRKAVYLLAAPETDGVTRLWMADSALLAP
jgi:hypothetical protein